MAYNPTADFYDRLGVKYEEAFGHDPGLRAFVQRLLTLLPAQASVLDVGSGTGVPTGQMVVASGRSYHGIDFAAQMIELSRQQVPQGTFTHVHMLEFHPAVPFDAAFSVFSLFHLTREEMDAVAARWPTWIKPGGILAIGTMVADDFPTRPEMYDADGLCARGIAHTFMGRRIGNLLYTKAGWKKMLEDAGFEILFTEFSNFQAPPEAQCDNEPHYYIAAKRL